MTPRTKILVQALFQFSSQMKFYQINLIKSPSGRVSVSVQKDEHEPMARLLRLMRNKSIYIYVYIKQLIVFKKKMLPLETSFSFKILNLKIKILHHAFVSIHSIFTCIWTVMQMFDFNFFVGLSSQKIGVSRE